MTFPIVGSECAPGILDICPAAEPGVGQSTAAATDLVRLFALDDLPAVRRRILCHWHRDADGRLACTWEPDIVGAMAVSLSTAYAVGDVLSLHHSLHRKPQEARAFYAVYGGLVVLAAALVLTPGTPLGLLTNAVQALAGVLLPSATVFLLLLCNDGAVLGPWVNRRPLNVFTAWSLLCW